MISEHDLIARLEQLGDELSFGEDTEARLVGRVLDGIGDGQERRSRRRWTGALVAAITLLVLGLALLLPHARSAVAHWFGLDAVEVGIDPHLSLPPPPSTFDVPAPGASRVVVVDGHQVLVSAMSGSLNEVLIHKTVGGSRQVQQVDVSGHLGLWVDGAPHEVMYLAPDGDVLVDRAAANTLLWQDGNVLYRIEGFSDLADALEFAAKVENGGT
jgi:hypothetical protein